MTAVATRELAVGVDGFTLPRDIVTQTIGILAMKRSGKSNAAVAIAEELFYADLHWVAIDPKGDWWGMRADGATGTGVPVLVMGGLHGDVPLEATAGKFVAEIIVEQHLTVILDVSEFSRADQRRFLTDFAERLYRINREPLLLICEEADEYIPQRVMGDMARLVGAFENIVKRGGFRGLGCILVTQRSASLNKDVLTQCETLIALRTTSAQDRKAIRDWVDHYSVGAQALDEIPRLENGEAWLFSPVWLHRQERVRFRRRHTFDSGATPEVGKSRPPARLADVDIAGLTERMAATIERAKAEDPKELRRQIAELRRQLAARPTAAAEVRVERVEVPVEVSVLTDEDRALLNDAAVRLEAVAGRLREPLSRATFERVIAATAPPSNGHPRSVRASKPAAAVTPPPDGATRATVTGSQQRVLNAVAWWNALGVATPDRSQVAFIAGVPITSGGYKNNLSALKTGGLIEYPGMGLVQLTGAGRALADVADIAPDQEALLSAVYAQLSTPLAALLRAVVAQYPEALTRQELADAVDVPATSGGFKNNCSRLKTLGFVQYPSPGVLRATPLLFLGEAVAA